MSRIDLLHRIARTLGFVGFAIAWLSNATWSDACAQDKIPSVLDRRKEEDADVEEDKDDLQRQNPRIVVNFAMDPERWSEMAYSSLGGSKATFEQLQRRRVRRTLNRIELVCGLSSELREKVQATAELETQRLDLAIASLVADAPRKPSQEEYQEFYQQIWKVIQPYQQVPQSNAGSINALWQKVLRGHLTSEQQSAIAADAAKRIAIRKKTQRLEVLLNLSRLLGLNTKQRTALEAYGESNPDVWSNFETAWATLQAFPDKEKHNMFRPAQIERLSKPLETSMDIRPIMQMEMD